MYSACRNVDSNQLGAMLGGKMLLTVDSTYNIDVHMV